MKRNSMKKLMRISKLQKIVAAMSLIVVLGISVPKPVHADDEDGWGGKLLKPVVQFFACIGDVVIGGLQHYMLRNK